jgi:DeoR/GlpR family transcriptional regulator of sugar metabolism
VVTVTESVKFGRKAFVRYAAVEQVNTLVTDTQLSPTDRKRLEESGVNVLLAEAN